MEHTYITIIGAGIVGLAVARELSLDSANIIVLERNETFGQETSSRNSEVIHAGLYYPPGSLKSETCIIGKDMLYDLCETRGIAHNKVGKLLVATTDKECERIHEIYHNAHTCGVTNCRFLSSQEILDLEPNIKVKEAFYSPDSGIVDTHGVMKNMYDEARSRDVNFAFSVEVIAIEKVLSGYQLTAREPDGSLFDFESEIVINAAGLHADTIAAMVGIDIIEHDYKIHYCKGQYFRIADPTKYAISHLVYPPPTDTSLGIHITPDLGGGLRLGPDAHYVDEIDYAVDPEAEENFFTSVKSYMPSLRSEDLIQDTSGMRPKLQAEGGAFRDFVIRDESDKGFPHFIDLIGLESPGLTASMAIAERVINLL